MTCPIDVYHAADVEGILAYEGAQNVLLPATGQEVHALRNAEQSAWFVFAGIIVLRMTDFDWCLVGNSVFEHLESELGRKIREIEV